MARRILAMTLMHPKPEPIARMRARKARKDAAALKAFRDAVWEREAIGHNIGAGLCEGCYLCVYRSEHPRGEVHHLISRRHKATRYDPANGQLLCRACHRRVTEHRN